MKLTILYDNEAMDGFRKGWGFSCLIEHNDRKILFDTGWDGGDLLFNMDRLGIAKDDFDIIVLSHDHWDHIGGLTSVIHSGADVHVPASFSRRLKGEISRKAALHEVVEAGEIMKGVYTTGELGSNIKEQSLALRTEDGIVVLTGCAHPGLDAIMDASAQFGKLHGAIGGFHGFDRFEHLEKLAVIAPCHCTAQKKQIEKRFSERIMHCGAGQCIIL